MAILKGSIYTHLVTFIANILAFLAGTGIGWTSPVLYILEHDPIDKIPLEENITLEEASWINSIKSLGAIAGALLAGILSQKIGRKYTEVILSISFLVSYLLLAFANSLVLFYIGRFITGMGVGGAFCTIPIYLVEISEDVNRGFLLASKTTFINLGMFFAYCVGPYVSIMIFNLLLAAISAIHILVFWYIAPETPHFLLMKHKEKEAYKSLETLRRRSSYSLRQEFETLQNNLTSSVVNKGRYLDIVSKRATRRAFLYLAACLTFQEFSGISIINSYTQSIFYATGSDIPTDVSAIVVSAAAVVVTFIIPSFMDSLGRRTLLFVAVAGATLANILLGLYFYLQDHSDVSKIGWLPLLGLILFTIFFNCGIGAIPWTYMGELVPIEIRSKVSIIITTFYWLLSFLITKYYSTISKEIGVGSTFWIFAGMCALFECFIYLFLFETKGKSLKEIQEILEK